MSVAKAPLGFLTGAYSHARKSGLLETGVGRWLFSSSYNLYKRYLEDPFYALTRRNPGLFRGGHILDIGANIGYTAMVFARAIDTGYRVYAFEPEDFNFALLRRAVRRGNFSDRIIPVRSAAGAEDGFAELWLNDRHHADHRILTMRFQQPRPSKTIFVPISKIDSFVARHGPPLHPIAFIKIDVQGYEFPVCAGMEQTLIDNPRAVVALEYSPAAMVESGFEPEEMLHWFQVRGYNAHWLARDGRLKSGLDPHLQETGYADLVLSRRPIAPV